MIQQMVEQTDEMAEGIHHPVIGTVECHEPIVSRPDRTSADRQREACPKSWVRFGSLLSRKKSRIFTVTPVLLSPGLNQPGVHGAI